MKTIIVTLITFFVTFAAFGQSELTELTKDSEYNLLRQDSLDQDASMAKVGVLMSTMGVLAEVPKGLTLDARVKNNSFCLKAGMLLQDIVNSAVRYGRHSKIQTEVDKAKVVFISGLSIASLCYKDKTQILNPEYVKTVFGDVKIFDKINRPTSPLQVISELNKITDANKVQD